MRLVLASASPRRADLLTAAGFVFDVRPVDLDETPRPRESPEDYVQRLALEKAKAGLNASKDEVVLGADTVVVVDGAILGKPVDDDEARSMLESLSGRDHLVLTGVALVHGNRELVELDLSRVHFLQVSAAEIVWYVASGEPRDKAGAYAIQGLASRFVDRIEGSYANVVGLPVARVYRMLASLAPDLVTTLTVTR